MFKKLLSVTITRKHHALSLGLSFVLTISLVWIALALQAKFLVLNRKTSFPRPNLAAALANAQAPIQKSKPISGSLGARLSEAYGKLPLSFEANQGQVGGQVKFLSRGKDYNLFLTPTEAVLQLTIADLRLPNESELQNRQSSTDNRQSSVLHLKLLGSNPHAQMSWKGDVIKTHPSGRVIPGSKNCQAFSDLLEIYQIGLPRIRIG